jgi:sugar fermentation stimulation protein A
MQLAEALHEGTLVRRYKRFLADVEMSDGEVIVVHCPNPGSMIGCAEPGSVVWLRKSTDPARRLPYTWVVTHWQNTFISVDTLLANKLVKEALTNGFLPALSNYRQVSPEYRWGDSRFDFALFNADETEPACIVEVKSTTLAYGMTAMFPDAQTERGRKHLRGLMDARRAGIRAVQFFCVARNDVDAFKPAHHIDEKYSLLLAEAAASGVEVMAWTTHITRQSGTLTAELVKEIPVLLP